METTMENIKMQRYPAYKDSGVEWIGSMPAHWEPKPGFTVIEERKEKNIGLKENKVLSLSYGNVIVKSEDKLTGLVPESFETYQLVYPGDIIVRPTDLQNDKTSLRTGLARDKGIITSAYINLKMKNGYSTSFFHYFLHSIDVTKVIYGLGSGLRQNLDFGDFKRFVFLVPPITEQTRIATFLDQKTAQIDQAIAQKERLIELLKERRQILIHNAVTRGLDPNVRMKDSGVEWIGAVPEHWEIKRLKHCIAKKIDNRGRTPVFGSEGIPMLEVKNITDGIESPTLEFEKFVLPKIVANYERDKVQIGDLLISTVGATSGKIVIILKEPDYFICQNVVGLRTNKLLLPRFASYALSSEYFKTSLMLINKGNTIDNLKVSIFINNIVFTPPINEQTAIVKYLETQTIKIESTIDLQKKQIEKLKEYKATLINSAVTGKIKIA
jgi:type I restriction enzyme S subunit